MKNRCKICGVILENNVNVSNSQLISTDNSINNQNLIHTNHCNRCNSVNRSISVNNPAKSLFYLFDGFKIILTNKKFLKLSVIPLLITIVFLIITYGGGLYLLFTGLGHYLPSVENQGVIPTLSKYALGAVGSLLILFITFFLFLPLSSIFCIPFNDIISAETEKSILGEENGLQQNSNIFMEAKVGIVEVFKLLFFKLIILIVAVPLNFIPGVGTVLFLLTLSLLVAIDFLDIVMARKKYSLSEKLKFINSNSVNFLFFSLPFMILFWIPIVQIFIIPCAAVAGTKFFIESKK